MPSMLKSGALLLVLAVLGAEIAPAGAQAPAIGTVEALVGAATATRFDVGAPRALAVGAELFEGDRIRTGAGARLRLVLLDGSVLTCGEATDLTLDWVLYAPEQDDPQSSCCACRSASSGPWSSCWCRIRRSRCTPPPR